MSALYGKTYNFYIIFFIKIDKEELETIEYTTHNSKMSAWSRSGKERMEGEKKERQ